jgi:hypothetical protein
MHSNGYAKVEGTDDAEQHPASHDGFDDLDNMSSVSDDEPTEEEIKTLRKIADQLPWSVWYGHPLPFPPSEENLPL